MSNEKTIEELVARVQALEEQVALLSQKVLGCTDDDKEKRCLPGFNSCTL